MKLTNGAKLLTPTKKENLVIKEQDVYMFRGMAVTGENALNAIQVHHGRIENNNTAIEALEKQIPQMVVNILMPNGDITGWKCLSCDKRLTIDALYCPNCGQKLDWSEE